MRIPSCVVTCTGGRPELFALCRRWVERCQPDHWVVTNDIPGDPRPDLPAGTTYIEIGPMEDAPTETVGAHHTLAVALAAVPKDHAAVIMEDDDWYPADYLRTTVEALQHGDPNLVGCSSEVRYHVPSRRYQRWRPFFPNAGSTTIHPRAIGAYSALLLGPHGSDNAAWQTLGGVMTPRTSRVAIKGVGFGLPGRQGATKKHDPMHYKVLGWDWDEHGDELRKMLGAEDADAYLSLVRQVTA